MHMKSKINLWKWGGAGGSEGGLGKVHELVVRGLHDLTLRGQPRKHLTGEEPGG